MCQKEQKEMWIEAPCCNYKAIAELKSFIKQRFCSFNDFQLILYVCMLLLPYVLWWWIKLQKPIYNTFSGGTWSTKTLVLGCYYQIWEKKKNNVKNDWIKEMTIKKMNKKCFSFGFKLVQYVCQHYQSTMWLLVPAASPVSGASRRTIICSASEDLRG